MLSLLDLEEAENLSTLSLAVNEDLFSNPCPSSPDMHKGEFAFTTG
jgi:hypothetical protein